MTLNRPEASKIYIKTESRQNKTPEPEMVLNSFGQQERGLTTLPRFDQIQPQMNLQQIHNK
jgi:hypothetical protein